MRIGDITLPPTAMLAPMAGVADRAFRAICKEFGACYLVGEMASSKGLHYSDRKTAKLLQVDDSQRPMAIQLFGDDPATMAEAAQKAMAFSPDCIDLNMGCPAPKVVNNGGGSALMRRPELAEQIIRAVVAAVKVPVTVKFRRGWDEQSVNAVEFARMAQSAGASAIAVHARTRQQMYAFPVDWQIIRQVKQAVDIPVIGNGGITCAADALRMYRETGCDLVMIGTAALGNPWIFSQVDSLVRTGTLPPSPTLDERLAVMCRHIQLACSYIGERNGMREARKHVAWYLKGVRGAAKFRNLAGQLTSYNDLLALCDLVKAQNAGGGAL